MLSELEQEGDVLQIRRSQFSLRDDREVPTPFTCIGPGRAKLWLQFSPVLEQIASVLDLRQERLPVFCHRNIFSVGDEQVRCVAPLLTAGVCEVYCERLLFVLKNILVEKQMLDEVAFQTRFVTSAARRLIIGYQPCNASIVRPDLPNCHPLRFRSRCSVLQPRRSHSALHRKLIGHPYHTESFTICPAKSFLRATSPSTYKRSCRSHPKLVATTFVYSKTTRIDFCIHSRPLL